MPEGPTPVQLKPATLEAFLAHVRQAEGGMEPTLAAGRSFLWSDGDPQIAEQVHNGEVVAQFFSSRGPVKIPSGLIHDWVGAASIPSVSLDDTLALVQNYDNHKNVYQPEVIDSRLISHRGNDFQIFLRLLKKKILTVVLDTDHDVHYRSLSRQRCFCRSYTTRISEVENAGTAREQISAPDTGYGFLWRLYSYWRFQEREGDVIIECRAISLTRDIPLGLGWIIEPIIEKLPRESLINTLAATRRALVPAR